MLVTQLGIATLISLAQKENAESPMQVTPLGIVTLVKLTQEKNMELLTGFTFLYHSMS